MGGGLSRKWRRPWAVGGGGRGARHDAQRAARRADGVVEDAKLDAVAVRELIDRVVGVPV
jgi:hypothetical protein